MDRRDGFSIRLHLSAVARYGRYKWLFEAFVGLEIDDMNSLAGTR